MNIQGKVSSFLLELLLGPVKICVESGKFILKDCKIQISIYVCMVCACAQFLSLFVFVKKSRNSS